MVGYKNTATLYDYKPLAVTTIIMGRKKVLKSQNTDRYWSMVYGIRLAISPVFHIQT